MSFKNEKNIKDEKKKDLISPPPKPPPTEIPPVLPLSDALSRQPSLQSPEIKVPITTPPKRELIDPRDPISVPLEVFNDLQDQIIQLREENSDLDIKLSGLNSILLQKDDQIRQLEIHAKSFQTRELGIQIKELTNEKKLEKINKLNKEKIKELTNEKMLFQAKIFDLQNRNNQLEQ